MKKHHPYQTTSHSTKLLWMSDLHMDLAIHAYRRKILIDLQTAEFDAAVITGDTASSQFIEQHLLSIASACNPRPVYLVLGNHDFYGSSIDHTREKVRAICSKISNLHHLQDLGPVWLNKHTALIGHHGWADARCGWGERTYVRNPDHWCIDDFRSLNKSERFELMALLGKNSSISIRSNLQSVVRRAKQLIIATHVPPFETSVIYDGKPCGPCHSAHFVNSNMGGMLIGTARNNPNTQFTVVSGHTHSHVHESILRNLESRVASAKKGKPSIQDILTF